MEFPLDYVRGCFEAPRAIHFRNASDPWVLSTVRRLRQNGASESDPEEILRDTRESLAFFLNSNDAWAEEEIVLAPDVRELSRRLAAGLAAGYEPGSEILLTDLDDEWNVAPWLALQERGIELRFWPLRKPAAGLDPARLPELLNDRTRLVVVSKASSAFGTIVELLPIALQIREHQSSFLVNWSSFLSHGAIDVRFLRADFVIASTSSLFGSKLAFLWGRREKLRELRRSSPGLFEGLEVDPREVDALGAALRYVEELGLLSHEMQIQPSEDYGRRRHMRRGMQAIRHYERALTSLALTRLARVPGVTVYGIRDAEHSALRTPRLFFRLEGRSPAEVALALQERNVHVEHGDCGCPRAMKVLGLPENEGAVSAALAHYNRESEVERFVEALHEM